MSGSKKAIPIPSEIARLATASTLEELREAFEEFLSKTPSSTNLDLQAIASIGTKVRENAKKGNYYEDIDYEILRKFYVEWHCERSVEVRVIVAIEFAFSFYGSDLLHYLTNAGAETQQGAAIMEDLKVRAQTCLTRCPLTERCNAADLGREDDCFGGASSPNSLLTTLLVAIQREVERHGREKLRAQGKFLKRQITNFVLYKNPSIEQSQSEDERDATAIAPDVETDPLKSVDSGQGSKEPLAEKARRGLIRAGLRKRHKKWKRRQLDAETRWYSIAHEGDRHNLTNAQIRPRLQDAGCDWTLDGHAFSDKMYKVFRDTARWVGELADRPHEGAREITQLTCDLIRLGIARLISVGEVASDNHADGKSRKGYRLPRIVDRVSRHLAVEWSKTPAARDSRIARSLERLKANGLWSADRYPVLFNVWDTAQGVTTILPWANRCRTARQEVLKEILDDLEISGEDFPGLEDLV